MLKLFIRKRSPPAANSAVCMAHRKGIKEVSDDKSSFVRKDVFKEYAQRMDERCGNHEDLIARKPELNQVDPTNENRENSAPLNKNHGAQASPTPEKEDGNPATQGADISENIEENKISRTLPALMRELGQQVIDGLLSRESAFQRGKNIIAEYSFLEQEHALLWVKHRAHFPGVVVVPPEMQCKLEAQKSRFVEDLNLMLADAEALFKKNQTQKQANKND